MKLSFSTLVQYTALASCFLCVTQAPAEVTVRENSHFSINFYNNGDTFRGNTSTMNWSQARIEQTLAASQLWIDTLANISASKIQLHITYTTFSDSNIIGGSMSPEVSFSAGAIEPGTTYTTASTTEMKWRAGIDTDSMWGASTPWDIYIQIGKNFTFSDNGFTRVLVHEIGHALGVRSGMYWTDTGARDTAYNKWDSLLVDANGNNLSTSDLYATRDSVLGKEIYLSDGDTRLQVYNPGTFEAGSSFAHPTDGSYNNDSDSILNYAGDPRTISPVAFSDLDLNTMRMLGWTLRAGIPEPATATLGLVGVFLLTLRRRRPQTA